LFVRVKDHAQGQHGHRIPASHIVTTARTPLSSRRDARIIHYFCKNEREIFRRSSRVCSFALSYLAKSVFPRELFFATYGNAIRQDRAENRKLICPTGSE
jgi:hypothetical protein